MYKVILADDSALSLKGLEKNLDFAAMGAELVRSFLSGMDVLGYLQEHPDIDLLISDIRMPHITGLELARKALTHNRMMKIILISAYDDFEYAQEALRIGVTDYVQKPIQYDELSATIQKALQKLEEERTVLRRLEAAQPQLRERFYQNLTRSRPLLAARTLTREADYLGIAVQGGSFICVAAAGEEAREDAPVDTEAMLLGSIMQTDALQAWFGAQLDCHLIAEQDDTLLILHAPLLTTGELALKAQALCEGFAAGHKGGNTVYFGVGTPQKQLWQIGQSIAAARRAVNRRFVYSDQAVFCHAQDEADVLPFLTHITETQGEMVQLLLRRDGAALEMMAGRLARDAIVNLKEQNLIIPYLVVLLSGVIGQIRQNDVDLSGAEHIISTFGAKNRHPVSGGEIEEMLQGFFRTAAAALDQSQQTYRQKLLAGVKEYIAAHLPDSQLRLESIADEAHVTYSHLSRVFKQAEGINVSEYITNKRIEKAMQLLRMTTDPISLVSDQVGYASPYYFSACFKRIAGVTPSEYRKGQPGEAGPV